jgi:hypothetical protein
LTAGAAGAAVAGAGAAVAGAGAAVAGAGATVAGAGAWVAGAFVPQAVKAITRMISANANFLNMFNFLLLEL